MKLTLTLEGTEENIRLPLHHNHYVQAALYQLLDPVYASFLHQEGYSFRSRQFRLFSFSRLMGRFSTRPKEKAIIFTGPIKLTVLTPLKPISKGILDALIKDENFRIGPQSFSVTGVKIDYPTVDTEEVTIRTLSPIVSYSTMKRADGRNFTYYFEPGEKEFGRIVSGNLYKKLQAWEPDGNMVEGEFDFTIKPVHSIKRRIIMYKGIVVKGYSGHYLIKGKRTYLEFALNVGLGGKSSQGFGAVEMA